MKSFIRKPVVTFFIAFLLLSAIFFLVPVNMFDAEYTFRENGVQWSEKTTMSLSYFIGIGTTPEQMAGVVSFKLLPMGYVLAFLILIGLPVLIAYRVHLANQQK